MAIREAFLQAKPVPWTPWSRALIEELVPKALDPLNPSSKPRQALFDYALWHGQQRWIERLAATPFQPAKGLVDDGCFNSAGSTLIRRMSPPEWDRLEAQTHRTVAASRQRHLQAYTARNFKDLLRLCDVHGVDHLTPAGATPLMLAARADNLPLVQALLAKGADPELRGEFGHTAWLHAVSRAMEESAFAMTGLPALHDVLAPAVLDLQTDGRLVRIDRHQGEYWVLTLMLAGLKTQWSSCVLRTHEVWKYGEGFFAEQLHLVLERLPPHLWSDKRRKRSYVNQVLARGEVGSSYQPARQLFARARHGHYLPNPAMLMRKGEGWVDVYGAFGLDWLDAGCGSEDRFVRTPDAVVARLGREDTTTEAGLPPAGSVE